MNIAVHYEPRARRIPLPRLGGDIAALDFGPEDRPIDVVFSHANGFNARTYRTILAPLATTLRVLALDLRGHGASTLPAEPDRWNRWDGYAEDLLALLEAAVDRPVVLAGHSIGATTSLIAAVRQPDRIRSLVLFEPVLLPRAQRMAPLWDEPMVQGTLRRRDTFPDREAALASYRGRGAFTGWSDAELTDYVAAAFRDTPDGQVTLTCRPEWEVLMYAYHDYDPDELLSDVRRPARIFAAETGSTMGAEARELAAGVEVVPSTTHFLPMQRPQLVRDALLAAVEDAGGSP
ncbi:alpha/beta fold hydrolase [Burkholderia sp. Bp9142]|uniref:alpha/beta fold hydrolase n=1 Tax=Burkholderia sp. Bp9142 TaxID=2184573 RepID=UPI000F5928F8|nr:alpha/beta hydrolase [Burkholderia sp. Bp9142]RQR24595.1 alpha/beta hydrolase [Burkholderia sp. Bp9142]